MTHKARDIQQTFPTSWWILKSKFPLDDFYAEIYSKNSRYFLPEIFSCSSFVSRAFEW